jgi:DNA-binding transcriptional regulator YdaS (Cro superfamily)
MNTSRPNEALTGAIAKYPSLKAFAAELCVPYQTVQQWMKNGVPAEYCPQIEKMTGGEALCEDLNSRVDWTYLRSTSKPAAHSRKPARRVTTVPP